MSSVLERERTQTPVRRRSPILDHFLTILGAVAALAILAFLGAAAAAEFWVL
jgi:hypothetical protein